MRKIMFTLLAVFLLLFAVSFQASAAEKITDSHVETILVPAESYSDGMEVNDNEVHPDGSIIGNAGNCGFGFL